MIVAAPLVDSLIPLQQFVFDGLTWEQYETLLDSLGERRLRHTFVEGSLEVVTPSYDHERYRQIKRSRHFPVLTSEEPTRFVGMRQELDDTKLELQFEAWVKEQL